MKYRFVKFFVFLALYGGGQTSIVLTNTLAEQILLGNYDPGSYVPTPNVFYPDSICKGLQEKVSADSLHSYLETLRMFQTRNSGSDTISQVRGIGAARRWVFLKFSQFAQHNQFRLKPSYLQFDQNICGINRHRNVLAVLPGTDTSDKAYVIIEAHLDTRCAGLCDTACIAEGMEDNGSGSAMVIELARVMTPYTFRRTIVFMVVTAEEQGLLGAQAYAMYASGKKMKIRAVLNNDVVGGVICGKTSSPPSCSGEGNIDSTDFRIFSYGGYNSGHKQLARFVKLEYKEMILPIAKVPMSINIMNAEDRSGRGGDHIPFRQFGFNAVRFTSMNENGNANVSDTSYHDRQHTSNDILGVDTDSDQVLDSFFVDFNYLARNTVINGNALAMAASGPMTPDFLFTTNGSALFVTMTQQTQYQEYRLALRTNSNDLDSVITLKGGPTFTLLLSDNSYIASVASVDEYGVESLFSGEKNVLIDALGEISLAKQNIELLQNKPNPFDETTTIYVRVGVLPHYDSAFIVINQLDGREVMRLPVKLNAGVNEVEFNYGYQTGGTFLYSLVIDGKKFATRKMVLSN
jgi:hypothetical protein